MIMFLKSLFNSRRSLQESEILRGTCDRHSHILYGVDDGVRTSEESLSILSYLEKLGVKELWCTPHVMEDAPNTTDKLKSRFSELTLMYEGSIRLHLAAEYMMDNLFVERLKSRDLLTMDDDIVLVETSTVVPPYDLHGTLSDMMSAGYRPMLAHPERYRFLELADLRQLHSQGVLLQLNIASLTGYYGNTARAKAESLLKDGLYAAYGSDCHREKVIKDQYSRQELKKNVLLNLAEISDVLVK